jgi:hypothetical protein
VWLDSAENDPIELADRERSAQAWRSRLVERDHVIGLEAALEIAEARARDDATRVGELERELKKVKAALAKAKAAARTTPSIRSSLRAIARRVKQRLRPGH